MRHREVMTSHHTSSEYKVEHTAEISCPVSQLTMPSAATAQSAQCAVLCCHDGEMMEIKTT